jgi:signal transduction histidine kinase
VNEREQLRVVLDAAGMGTFMWCIQPDFCEPDDRMHALLGSPADRTFSFAHLTATLVHPADRQQSADAIVRAIDAGGDGTLREEIRVTQPDGSVKWLSLVGETSFEPIPDESAVGPFTRRAVRMFGTATDITNRKISDARNALVDQIADDCARFSSAEAIMDVVGKRLGTYLHAPSVCLVEVDERYDELRIVHMWNEAGTPIRPQAVPISDFVSEEFRSAARAGKTLLVHDSELDSRTDAGAHADLGIRAFMSVPFIRDGAWKFLLAVCDSRPHVWSDDDVSLFEQITERLFARLEHALAEQAVANDLRDTQLLRDLSGRLVSESDTQAFFDAIVAAAISITDARAGCLRLLGAEARQLEVLAHYGYEQPLRHRFSLVTGAAFPSCGRALATRRREVVYYDDPEIGDPDGSVRQIVEAGFRSGQSTPLVTRAGRMVGMLSTQWGESRRRLTERELRFLDLLARQAAEMIEHRRSEDALRESERRLSEELADTRLLQRLSAQLIEHQGSASLYDTLLDAATTIVRCAGASLQMLHPERGWRGELRLLATRGFSSEARQLFEWVGVDAGTTCAMALRSGSRVVVPDITQCNLMAGTTSQTKLLEAGFRAAQTTPLVSRIGRTLGMMTTYWTEPHQPSERDFRLLDILARQAADLMERTQAADALRRSESRLKEADRRKDEFLATLAHELRNPLAPLRTSLELIRLAGDTPHAIGEARQMMEEQVGVLIRLVDDLLEVSRITSGKIRLQRRPIALAALVSSAVQTNREALESGQLTLTVNIPDTPVLIDADPIRFVQIISNVLHNAIKFTDPGGRISISAAAALSEAGREDVTCTVVDSGIGIPSDMLPRVFELFAQADATANRPHAGLGIGLALARRLVEMHGGSIDVQSDGAGLGSTFTVRVPVSTHVAETRPAPPPLPPRISRRVVVIDDNLTAAIALQRLVTVLGGECRVAGDGESGLAHIRELRPDVVLLDIGMPGLDGYETCRRIRKEFGTDVMVVALTGWGREHDKQKAMFAGFDVHLTKPADPVMLEGLLATAGPAAQ